MQALVDGWKKFGVWQIVMVALCLICFYGAVYFTKMINFAVDTTYIVIMTALVIALVRDSTVGTSVVLVACAAAFSASIALIRNDPITITITLVGMALLLGVNIAIAVRHEINKKYIWVVWVSCMIEFILIFYPMSITIANN